MPFDWDSETTNGIEEIYSWDDDDPQATRRIVFRIDAAGRKVEFFPRDDDFPVKRIVFEGFRAVPQELNPVGYIKTTAVQYYLRGKLGEIGVRHLTIGRQAEKRLQKTKDGYRLTLPYTAFRDIVNRFKAVSQEAQSTRRVEMDSAFHGLFPRVCKEPAISRRQRASRFLSALDDTVIPELGGEDVDRVLDFTKAVLEKKYQRADRRHELFSAAKLKVDSVALGEVIAQFEQLLATHHPESRWGDFLRRNLFLVESRYVHVIEQLNVVLGGSRKVDFGLVDSAGFLDLFEIKIPQTQLIAKQPDRGNFYWHSDAVKAITQAEKYLYNAEGKRDSLAADVRRERKLDVRIVRPRAVVVMGMSGQLDTADKEEDFRVLRQSLKNVEVVLYDELLDRLKNQMNKIYVA